jgi:hypothetical protein
MLPRINGGDALLAAVIIAVSGDAAFSFLIREKTLSESSVSRTMSTAEGLSLRASMSSVSPLWLSASTRTRDVAVSAS